MARIEIYTMPTCPYCHAAKAFLAEKGVDYTEITVCDPALRAVMIKRAHGRRSVPQIFIGVTHIGGYDDMVALDRRGDLDPLLASSVSGS